MRKPMTLTQKILAAHAIGLNRPWVEAGDVLRIKVDWTIASELAWNGMAQTWERLGKPKVHDRERFYLAVDHTVDPVTLANDKRTQKLTQLSRDFAKESGIRHFYDANETILHTKFYRDLVQPGEVVLGADSHTSSHGGMGAFSMGLGGADITAAMVLGESWIEVPEAIAVDYAGELAFGIGGKDVILETLGKLGRNTVAMERSVEYRGDAVRRWSTDVRFTIANMTAELGGLNGIFEPDEVVADWLSQRATHKDSARYFRADDDAPYAERFRIDLSKLGPVIAKPFSPDNVFPVEALLGMELQGAFIGACTTTEEELVLGALVLEKALAAGMKPVDTQKRLVVPGDLAIVAHLRETGLAAIYEKAGFRVGPPGCSMCLGIASERAGKGEAWITSQNRNFENRMGEGSLAYLASAATVAASALSLRVADPRPLLAQVDQERFAALLRRSESRLPEITVSEPKVALAAEAHAGGAAETGKAGSVLRAGVQRFGDSVDTDAIIPGDFCHLTKLEEIGEKCFHFVRPEFVGRSREGRTIVVAGEGWGSGSSREHAVWALKGAGVECVIAKSYAFIHKRNLVNEALPYLTVKDEEFYALTQEGDELSVDLGSGRITHVASGRVFEAQTLAQVVQALGREGGLVPAIQRHGAEVFSVLSAG
ncbi:aconitase family protein [Vulgatibacter incomptus]|uniref:Aconitate hydratase A n=1 Tax=Vulgatibacter incomptus TaxID=1391653 RepID=A0A0K1PDC0_9BACT|nr:aconitase family protein [Vulgatibacter incomptus]AKU91497.1 3-isopropylmalate dehydratase large subunit [Vulgatibacter incomptus]